MIKILKKNKYYLMGLVIVSLFVVLPFISNWPNFISGIDYTFTELYSNIFLERIIYAWSAYAGNGLQSPPVFFGNIIYIPFITILSNIFKPNIVQIAIFLLFFSIAYTGIYLLLNLFSKRKDVLLISLLSIFYCINLVNYTFFNIPLYFYLSFFAFTPLLMWLVGKIIITNSRKYKIIYIIVFLLNLITFLNLANALLQLFLIIVAVLLFSNNRNYKNLLIPFYIFNPYFNTYSLRKLCFFY